MGLFQWLKIIALIAMLGWYAYVRACCPGQCSHRLCWNRVCSRGWC